MAELGFRSVYEVTGGRFTLTRFEPDRVNGRKLVRETYQTGEQFTAYNYEVPAGFMDLVKVVGPAPAVPAVPPPKDEVPTEDHTGVSGKESRKRPEAANAVEVEQKPDPLPKTPVRRRKK